MEAQRNAPIMGEAPTGSAEANSQVNSYHKMGWPVRLRILAVSLISLVLVSYIDWYTGYEELFFIFYFVPVAFCAWRLSQAATVMMAVLAGVGWFITDWWSGHVYSQEWLRYWNGFICFLAFALLGLIMHRWQRSLQEQRKAREELARALEEIRRSTEEIRKLQGQLQVVCAWTKRIKIDGRWISFDEFLTSKLHVSVSHGISPEAYEEIKKSLR